MNALARIAFATPRSRTWRNHVSRAAAAYSRARRIRALRDAGRGAVAITSAGPRLAGQARKRRLASAVVERVGQAQHAIERVTRGRRHDARSCRSADRRASRRSCTYRHQRLDAHAPTRAPASAAARGATRRAIDHHRFGDRRCPTTHGSHKRRPRRSCPTANAATTTTGRDGMRSPAGWRRSTTARRAAVPGHKPPCGRAERASSSSCSHSRHSLPGRGSLWLHIRQCITAPARSAYRLRRWSQNRFVS